MTAPIGAEVGIHVDLVDQVVAGDAIVTQTGRTYLVVSCRRQQRGIHAGRQHLRCLVAESPPPAGVRVHRIRWYKRGRRR